MAYALIDDAFLDHPKVIRAGEDAASLMLRSILWCAKQLTDGAVPTEALDVLSRSPRRAANAARLVEVGLWNVTPEGWQLHDYLDWNKSRSEVLESRRANADRKKKSIEKKKAERAGNAGITRESRVTHASAGSERLHTASSSSPLLSTPLHSVEEVEEEAAAPPLALVPEKPKRPRKSYPGPTLPELQALWNERAAAPMPRCLAPPNLSGPQERHLRETPIDGPTGWAAIIDRMNASGFCRGERGDRGAVGIAFLLRHPADVLNGTYDDRKASAPTQAGAAYQPWKAD